MNSSEARPTRIETIISIMLIIILILISIGVFIKQFDYDIKKFGIVTDVGKKVETPEIDIENLDIISLAPDGYKKYLNSETYTSDNLYEKINGKAPLYLDAGFNKLLSQRFASIDDEKQWLEVFIYEENYISGRRF